MNSKDARARVESNRQSALAFSEDHPSITAESVNAAADEALRAIETRDIDRFAEAFETLLNKGAIAFAMTSAKGAVKMAEPFIAQGTFLTRQTENASKSRSELKEQARALWDSMERKPHNWVTFENVLKKHGIECKPRTARDWYSKFRQSAT